MSTISTANSFVTLAEADTYFSDQYHRYSTWDGLTDIAKTQLLIEATSMMVYQLRWIMSLDPDLPGDNEYVAVKNACCEQAWYIYNADRQSYSDTKGLSHLKADVLEMDIDKTDRAGMFAPSLSTLLSGYAYVPGSINRPVVRG